MKRKIITALFFILIMSASSQAFSGREKWQFQPEGPATSGIALSGNAIFFGTETGNFYALDKNTGRVIWQLKTEHNLRNSLNRRQQCSVRPGRRGNPLRQNL